MSLVRHLAVRCRDLEKSRRFYERGFGWEFIDYRPGGGGLDLTDGQINITLIQQPNNWTPSMVGDGNENQHVGVIVDDLEACRRRLIDLGAGFATDSIKSGDETPEDNAPEVSFKVFDPDGNVIDVTVNREEWHGVRFP